MRADARRNYERLIDEASRAFREQGVDASLEEIARRAGVAIGTLYRHFPTRNALLEALLRERFDGHAATAGDLLQTAAPLAALRTWTRELVGANTDYRGLVETMADAMADESSALHRSCEAMRAAAGRLVARAQDAGELRPDVTTGEVLLAVHAAGWAAEHGGSLERQLDLVFDGLCAKPPASLNLPGKPHSGPETS
jgi:AcrR family transcriptional regulator